MNATETDVIEETILDDEPGCEFRHGPTLDCTHHVTHRIIACTQQGNVCDAAAALTKDRMESGHRCSGCHGFAADCWYLRVI